MKKLTIYRPSGGVTVREYYVKGERAETNPNDFVQDIQILEGGKMVAISFGREQSKIFGGLPFEYQELNEADDSFYMPKEK